jgi:uncharacterized OB-fold protein
MMTTNSIARDVSRLEIAMDAWTQPFWEAAAERSLVVPRCDDCATFRWPPGPFCPECRSQATSWIAPGSGEVYSFTVLPVVREAAAAPEGQYVPVLICFPDADGIVLLGSLIDAPLGAIAIGAPVTIDWLPASNTQVPVFRLA